MFTGSINYDLASAFPLGRDLLDFASPDETQKVKEIVENIIKSPQFFDQDEPVDLLKAFILGLTKGKQ